ncbi:MAG: ABC transporter ATP-binding protein, partial [Planctomycetota bacterium]|nr:ABC transporter ATP-binding protein [Planctomycetota bacterium]
EPTDGVDPIGRKQIREILVELRQAGKTVFINSHILRELEMVCDRVAILVHGQVARQGTVEELTAHSLTYQVTTTDGIDSLRDEIVRLGAEVVDRTVTIKGNDAGAVNQIIDFLRSKKIKIESVRPRRWSLDDFFIDAAAQLQGED